MEKDFRKVAIEINDELIGVLGALLVFHRLVREISPPKVLELVSADIDADEKRYADWLVVATARKQKLENEEE